MSKQIVYLVTVVVCIVLQAGISPAISIFGCSPNFLLIPVLLICMRSSLSVGCSAAFLFGLLYDLMGIGTVGCMALVFTVIAFIVGMIGENVDLFTPVATIIVSVISSFVLEIGYGITAVLTSSEGGSAMSTILTYSLPSALYTAVICIIALLTIGLVVADDSPAAPTRLGDRKNASMRNMSKMKSRLK